MYKQEHHSFYLNIFIISLLFIMHGCATFHSTPEKVQEIVSKNGKEHDAYELRRIGRQLFDENRILEALKVLKIALEKNKADDLIWNNIGWIYKNIGEHKMMQDAFQHAVDLNSYRYWNRIGLCQSAMHVGDYKAVMAALDRMKSINDKDCDELYYLYKYVVMVALDKEDENQDLLQKGIELSEKDDSPYSVVGGWLKVLGCYKKAIYYLEKSIEAKEKDKDKIVLANLGWAYQDISEYEKMRDAFERAISQRETAWKYIGLGLSYIEMYDNESAIKEFTKALNTNDQYNFYGYLYLGLALYQSGEKVESQKKFDKFISCAPVKYDAYKRIGRIHYLYTNNSKEAIKYLTMASRLKTEVSQYVENNAGWVYEAEEKYDLMEQMFKEAVSGGECDTWNYVGLALAQIYLSNWKGLEDTVNTMKQIEFIKHRYMMYDVYRDSIHLTPPPLAGWV